LKNRVKLEKRLAKFIKKIIFVNSRLKTFLIDSPMSVLERPSKNERPPKNERPFSVLPKMSVLERPSKNERP
jgi:hypothetical protein